MALPLATQILTLAKDPETRPLIFKDNFFPYLVMCMENDDSRVVNTALEAINYLSQSQGHKDQVAKEPGLISGVRKHMVGGHTSSESVNFAVSIASNLGIQKSSDSNEQASTTQTHATTTTNSQTLTHDPFRTPLKEKRTFDNNHFEAPSTGLTGLSLYSDKITSRLNTAKTYNFFIKGLNSNDLTKQKVESCLLGTKGVVSFLIESPSNKAVVRTINQPDAILGSLKEAGVIASSKDTFDAEADDKENTPGYLPEYEDEAPAKKGSGWGWGIVSFGAKMEEKPKKAGGWGWSSVAKAIWG